MEIERAKALQAPQGEKDELINASDAHFEIFADML